jgi:hypothetical protein
MDGLRNIRKTSRRLVGPGLRLKPGISHTRNRSADHFTASLRNFRKQITFQDHYTFSVLHKPEAERAKRDLELLG